MSFTAQVMSDQFETSLHILHSHLKLMLLGPSQVFVFRFKIMDFSKFDCRLLMYAGITLESRGYSLSAQISFSVSSFFSYKSCSKSENLTGPHVAEVLYYFYFTFVIAFLCLSI